MMTVAAARASTPTVENLQQIQIGDTREAVIARLGPPITLNRNAESGEELIRWRMKDGDFGYVVLFESSVREVGKIVNPKWYQLVPRYKEVIKKKE